MDAQTKQWTKMLDDSYAKLPALPANIRELLVTIAPWLALIGGVLSVLGFLLSILGAGTLAVLAPYAAAAGVGGYAVFGLVIGIIALVQGVLMLLAFGPLKARKVRGWNLLFWVLVLSILSSVVTLNLFSVVWAVVGALIGYYILYQVRSYYK